ncbi:hypothetical protein NPIL_101331 [Nephila pilipes]|uniref:CCHC-type domain-containing protein n=1 Tax=Nephila pilipes TaxID=299642 RepID=A0A8X6NRK4_NEPPI|nr:hypothetical protein NPIL_101331 [Nephila pilipes]
MTLDQAFEQTRTIESAEVHAASYMGSSYPVQSAATKTDDFSEETLAASAASSSSRFQKCFFCGNDLHFRTICPARDVICRKCVEKGHYQRVCKSRPVFEEDISITLLVFDKSKYWTEKYEAVEIDCKLFKNIQGGGKSSKPKRAQNNIVSLSHQQDDIHYQIITSVGCSWRGSPLLHSSGG